jgi:hypothetical protein
VIYTRNKDVRAENAKQLSKINSEYHILTSEDHFFVVKGNQKQSTNNLSEKDRIDFNKDMTVERL